MIYECVITALFLCSISLVILDPCPVKFAASHSHTSSTSGMHTLSDTKDTALKLSSVVAVLSSWTAEIQENSVAYLDYSDAFSLLLSHTFSCYAVFAVDTNTRTRKPAC